MKTILSFLSPRSGIYPGAPRPFIARSAFILLIALAISACSEEAMNTDTDAGKMEGIPLSDVPIAFTDPGQEKGDGLLPLSTGDRTTDNLSAMTVYAHYTGDDDFDDVTSSTPNFMFAQSVTKDGSGWTYSPLKYWPAQHEKVSFFAIAPGPTEGNGIELITSNDSYTGYPSFTVTPPASPALQEDFCVASALNRADDTDGGKVPLHFDHTMAKVTFAAKYISDETFDVVLEQLKLSGIYNSNTLHLTATGFTWDTPDDDNKGDYTLAVTNNTLVGTSLIKAGNAGDATVSTEVGTLMLVPQTIPAGATLEVTTRWVGKVTEIRKINMPELTMGAGKSYNYNLTIDENSLSSFQWDWEYTAGAQTFTAPKDGTYILEAWGAGGGTATHSAIGGPGGYTRGEISLTAGQTVYVYVGQAGDITKSATDYSVPPTFNGGGQGGRDTENGGTAAGSGGGATDFRLVDGDWDNASSLNSRIMVAGGGGGGESAGASCIENGGYSGGLTGGTGEGANLTSHGANGGGCGGSQTAGGAISGSNVYPGQFGIGGNGGYALRGDRRFGGGGGGGYYGGGAGGFTTNWRRAGGGGSSFISGMTNCVAIDPTDITNDPRTQDSNGNTTALNYNSAFGTSPTWNDGAEILFTNPSMIDGEGYEWNTGAKGSLTNMPNWSTCCTTITGNIGNGYARITLIQE